MSIPEPARGLPPEITEQQRTVFAHFERLFKTAHFAPGEYHCKCETCDSIFIGDKRATRCFHCASDLISDRAMRENT